MIKKLYFILFLVCVFLSGCAEIHYIRGTSYVEKGEFEKAISEYNKGISTNDYRTLWALYNNIGISYSYLNKPDEAEKYLLKAVNVWPERAYYSYWNLAIDYHKQGNLIKAVEYSRKAYNLVHASGYDALEASSGYDVDTVKLGVIAAYDYYQLALDFSEIKKQFQRKQYYQLKSSAKKILSKKYRIDIGIHLYGNIVQSIIDGSIAELNGIIKGDEILDIDGTRVTDMVSTYNSLAKLSDRFEEKVNIKIKRNNREITIICYLYYPELENTKILLTDSQKYIERKVVNRDSEQPQILVINPKVRSGKSLVNENVIDFVFLASDNYRVNKVFIDGREIDSSDASPIEKTLLKGQVKKYVAKIPLKTENSSNYIIKAIDSSGNIARKKITIVKNFQENKITNQLYRHSIAVVIGINSYYKWPSLEFAVSDARAIKDRLIKLGFDRVIELYDGRATRLQILKVLADELPNKLGVDDRIMIYFAGHGHTETFENKESFGQIMQDKEGYIIPVDGELENFQGSAISMSSIREMAKKYKAKHILFAFDSCYSGLGLKRSGGINIADDYIKKLSKMESVQIITAGGENEKVGEENGHGIFTRHLLFALGGKADLDNDGFITASEIGSYIRPIVSRKTKNTQTPKFGWISGEGDFIFESLI